MATWVTVKDYLTSQYRCRPFDDDGLKLVFDIGEGRSQVVLVLPAGPSGQEPSWVDFHSPLGDLEGLDVVRAVRATHEWVAGGISALAGIATVRVSVPLENLDQNEIEEPMRVVCVAGDEMERRLTGVDIF